MTEQREEPSKALVPVVTASPQVADAVGQATHLALGAALLVTDGIGAALRGGRADAGNAPVPGPAAAPGPAPGAGAGAHPAPVIGAHPGAGADGGAGSEPSPHDAPSPAVVARRLAIGAAFDAQRRAASVAEATVKVVGPTARWLVSNPLLRPVRDVVGHQVEKVYHSGLAEEAAAREVAARTVESSATLVVPVVLDHVDLGVIAPQVLDRIELGPLVERIIAQIDMNALVGGVIGEIDVGPIVEDVLAELDLTRIVDGVLDEIELGPVVEKVLGELDLNAIVGELEVGNVVLEATGGMTAEIVNEIRNRGADGDALVEIVFDKVLRRKRRPLPPVAFPHLVEEAP